MSNQQTGIGAASLAGPVFYKSVKFTGTGAVIKGQGLCYAATTGTSTDADGNRTYNVALPTSSNNNNFAGWAVQDYSANSAGQYIIIAEPGSACEVLTMTATTVNTGRITASLTGLPGSSVGLGTGLGLHGRGSAVPLQTTATATVTSGVGPILGLTTGTYVTSTKTLTATLTNAAVGDKVIVVGGRDSSYVSNTPGVYTIATLVGTTPNFTSCTLSTDLSGSATDPAVSFYLVRGNPTVLCQTESGGEQSGCVEFLAGIGNGAVPAVSVGGTTVFLTATNASATYKPAMVDGTILEQRKNFYVAGTQTTNGIAITPTSSNIKGPGAAAAYYVPFTAITTITSSTIGHSVVLEWLGVKGWQIIYNVGFVIA